MNNIFKEKKVAVLGLSTEGIESVKYLIKSKAIVTACDRKTDKELPENIINFLKKSKVNLNLGPKHLDNLNRFQYVFRSPGIPFWNNKLKEAKKNGVIITSLTKVFFDICDNPIIGITGTKGKGTTSSLIGKILEEDNKKVYVGGNIGNPLINKLDNIPKNAWIILELSSFQLEDIHKSPKIAVVLNITNDHLASSSKESPNYHNSINEYIEAKRNIVNFQKENDFAVLNSDYGRSLSFKDYTKAKIYTFSIKTEVKNGAFVKENKIILSINGEKHLICKTEDVLLRGIHNLENITAAITASYLTGVKISSIINAVKNFKGLEHRLELIGEKNGVTFYNDSFSTTPETTIAAIKSFNNPIILIAGGSDKGADYSKLGEEIGKSTVKAVILIGLMKHKIEKAIKDSGIFSGKIINNPNTMKEIVKMAVIGAKKGDIILLSPGCASFDMFKNYKDRGDQFKSEFDNL